MVFLKNKREHTEIISFINLRTVSIVHTIRGALLANEKQDIANN